MAGYFFFNISMYPTVTVEHPGFLHRHHHAVLPAPSTNQQIPRILDLQWIRTRPPLNCIQPQGVQSHWRGSRVRTRVSPSRAITSASATKRQWHSKARQKHPKWYADKITTPRRKSLHMPNGFARCAKFNTTAKMFSDHCQSKTHRHRVQCKRIAPYCATCKCSFGFHHHFHRHKNSDAQNKVLCNQN